MNYKNKSDLTSTEKVYWYLRYLIETDRGAFAKNFDKVSELANSLGVAITSGKEFNEEEHIRVLNNICRNVVLSASRKGTKVHLKLLSLIEGLELLTTCLDDYKTLVFCLNELMIPSNQALETVPTTEATQIAKSYAKSVLEEKGTLGLANILREWDSITLDICLNTERDIAAKLFRKVREKIEAELFFIQSQEALNNNGSSKDVPLESDIILSALMQEFERRLGQKRKQRSGQDLEDATAFIFDHYGISCAEKPSHFTASIEVDNWVKDKKGWYLGFSLKRTLRERWKQTLTDKDTLTQFKIRHIIHLICNDGDLTEAKIGEMGSQRHLFFVPDNSSVLDTVKGDNVLSEYVKPMSTLITFLKASR